jgi:hypothetical protein
VQGTARLLSEGALGEEQNNKQPAKCEPVKQSFLVSFKKWKLPLPYLDFLHCHLGPAVGKIKQIRFISPVGCAGGGISGPAALAQSPHFMACDAGTTDAVYNDPP